MFFFFLFFIVFILFCCESGAEKESVTTGTLLFFDHDVACLNASEHMSVCGVYACMSVCVVQCIYVEG